MLGLHRYKCMRPMALHDVALISVVLLGACIGGNERSDQGRGTETCRIWQDAACDHFADTCSAVDRKICDHQYQSVSCRSDRVAANCTKMLRSVSCGGASPDCLLGEVADPEPARAACEELRDSFCARSVECELSDDMDECVRSTSQVLPCERAVGFQLGFETCLKDIDKADCTALTLPTSCASVIIARE
jgi:hypothetical protein